MAKKRRSKDDLKEIDVLVEGLREFVRLNCMTAAEVARQIGVNFEAAGLDFGGINECEFLPDFAVAICDQNVRICVCAY